MSCKGMNEREKMKKGLVYFFAFFVVFMSIADVSISNLKVTPMSPFGMAIDFTVSGATEDIREYPMAVSLTSGSMTYGASPQNVSGDVDWYDGQHRIYWNVAREGFTNNVFNSTVVVGIPLYCVIDLSTGVDSTNYPVSYFATEPSGGFNTSAYKTSKMVLKLLNAGTYKMQNSKLVTLSKPFYMGIFEVTRGQWCEVMGSVESSKYGSGSNLAIYCVSYSRAAYFIRLLQTRTGLDFSLPTEAQWEYACRAGTTTKYSYGDYTNDEYMWCSVNSSSEVHPVGSKKPNPWGLYDMHGNVAEWCSDWSGTLTYGTDPKGPDSSVDECRVVRGGGWNSHPNNCASSARGGAYPSHVVSSTVEIYYKEIGFRLSRTLP